MIIVPVILPIVIHPIIHPVMPDHPPYHPLSSYTGIPKSTVHRYLQAVDRGLQSASDYEVSEDGSIKKRQDD